MDLKEEYVSALEKMLKSFVDLHLLKIEKVVKSNSELLEKINSKDEFVLCDVLVSPVSGKFLVSKITLKVSMQEEV